MDTPGNDPASVAAMAAGGAQVVVFSSGRGSPIGSPIVPVIKITGNKITFANMEDNIDFNAAPLIYGERTVERARSGSARNGRGDRERPPDQGRSARLHRNRNRASVQLRITAGFLKG